MDYYIDELHELLKSGNYKTSIYHTKIIYEPKERTIYILPFYPDRIVHHAIMNILEPIWDNLFIYDSYSCRKGKGQHKGSYRCLQFTKRYKYCLKGDFSKFYPSIVHEVLKKILRRKIKDKKLLKLLDEIIDSAYSFDDVELHKMLESRGIICDDSHHRNVPIGNYLSQWFGNLYLNELDTLVKQELKAVAYIRFCDDYLIFSDDINFLKYCDKVIVEFTESYLGLKLSKHEIFQTKQGVDFLGYRHFPDDYILVRKSTAKRIKKRLKNIDKRVSRGKISVEKARAQWASAKGWIGHANAHNFSIYLKMEEIDKFLEEKENEIMKGVPKFLNTRDDYDYMQLNFPKEVWQPFFQALLDTRNDWFFVKVLAENEEGIIDDTHKVEVNEETGIKTQFEYRFNNSCKLRQLGYTVDEVERMIRKG